MISQMLKVMACKKGNSMVEYGLLVALIAGATLVATTHMGVAASGFFRSVTGAL